MKNIVCVDDSCTLQTKLFGEKKKIDSYDDEDLEHTYFEMQYGGSTTLHVFLS